MKDWKTTRQEIDISSERKSIVEIEKELIRTIISVREEQGLTQSELAAKCNLKQPMISRLEKDIHSPQVDSLLRVLTPLGYKLQIVRTNQAVEK